MKVKRFIGIFYDYYWGLLMITLIAMWFEFQNEIYNNDNMPFIKRKPLYYLFIICIFQQNYETYEIILITWECYSNI